MKDIHSPKIIMKMKCLRISVLTVMALFISCTNVTGQGIETKVTHLFSVYEDQGWKKYFYTDTPATIFAYNKKGDTYTFGFYSDDYAGIIDLRIIPFDINEKQLKKLPKADKKKITQEMKTYYRRAFTNARKNAFNGKYRIDSYADLYGDYEAKGSVSKKDTITIIGYKTKKDFQGTTSYFAIIKNDAAGVFHPNSDTYFKIEDIPLSFLPSTDDPQVKEIIAKEKQRIIDEQLSKEKKEREERAALQKSIEEQEFAELKSMDPAYIEVKKIIMDSAGGNEVTIKFTNCSSQRVKYVHFTGYFLNAVGDKCKNEVGGSTVWKYTGVGPVSRIPNTPDRFGSYITYFHSDPLFYSKNARKLILSSVTIEYMNGKKIVLSGSKLEDRVDYQY